MYCLSDGINNPVNQATSIVTLCGAKRLGVGGDYITLTAAIADLNSKTLRGALNLTLTDPTYPNETFPLVIDKNADSSSTNTIIIKQASEVSPIITCNTYKFAFILNGSDYVIIDGSNQVGGNSKDLTIVKTYIGDTLNCVLGFYNNGITGATNSTIKNCIIKCSPTVKYGYGKYLNDDGNSHVIS